MRRKTKAKWFIASTLIAVVGFWLPTFARDMYQKGNMAENASVLLVTVSVPIAFLTVVVSISFLISLFINKK